MYVKRSQMLQNIQATLKSNGSEISDSTAESLLKMIEIFMEPKLRPLTQNEVEEHVLVKQVHHSRKDEVRNYVRNLEYEWKKEYLPEDT